MSSFSGHVTKPLPPPPSYSSDESINGLKFGQKIYFEDGIGTLASTNAATVHAKAVTTTTTPSSSSSSSKKGRVGKGGIQGTQPPRCQVEGCNVDLSDAKAYYSRHKVCGLHSKSPAVVVSGLEQRFCQQCSRFHQLPEFDQEKRSCRRRLAGHNERRRKPPPSSLLTSRYARLSSPIIDYSGGGSGGGGFLMEFSSYPKLTARNVLPTLNSSHPVPENQSAQTWQANSGHNLNFTCKVQSAGQASLVPDILQRKAMLVGVTDSSCALSLLSSQAWGPINMAPSVELNNLFNFNGTPTPTTQLPAASHVASIHQLPNSSWCFKGIDSANCSHEVVPDIGLGQNLQPPYTNLLGEHESPHWSL